MDRSYAELQAVARAHNEAHPHIPVRLSKPVLEAELRGPGLLDTPEDPQVESNTEVTETIARMIEVVAHAAAREALDMHEKRCRRRQRARKRRRARDVTADAGGSTAA